MERDVLGGGQPAGLAAASAWGRRPPSGGGGPKNTTDSHSETPCIKVGAHECTRNEVPFPLIFGRTLRIQCGFIYEAQRGAILYKFF